MPPKPMPKPPLKPGMKPGTKPGAKPAGKPTAADLALAQKVQEFQAKQKTTQEAMTNAIRAHAQEFGKIVAENNELKKIKVEAHVVKYLMEEFDLELAEAEKLLRVNNNDLDAVLTSLLTA